MTLLGIVQLIQSSGAEPGAGQTQAIEFFEKRVRPVLVERCYQCHSARAEKLKGGLLLDSRASLLKGGAGGPVIVPGHPELSRFIQAVLYTDPDLQMPPKGRLADEQVADLTSWVQSGALWPDEVTVSATAAPLLAPQFDLAKRRQSHWAWQPVRTPDLPEVRQASWPRTPVDQFVLAKLEASQLRPAPRSEMESLFRRVSFDLVGLPPTPEEMAQYASEPFDQAFQRWIDQLLSSPRFGERWARHWLDLVRYSETLGHEFDYPNANAWRYRDYVIRAFNADVPYDQFVKEHIAGDLLNPPRRHPTEKFNESIIGTAFYWLGQRDHSPVDVRQHQAELIDNQIDVLTKTFLGLTVACARCHDHKFDAISSKDYYALYGILSSSRYDQRSIDPPEPLARKVAQLQALKQRLRGVTSQVWQDQARQTASYLLAAEELTLHQPAADSELDELAAEFSLDPVQLERWTTALEAAAAEGAENPLFAWIRGRQMDHAKDSSASEPGSKTTHSTHSDGTVDTFADFTRTPPNLAGWFIEGEAFATGPCAAGDFVVGTAARPIEQVLERPAFDSALLSRQLEGVLRSPTFEITNRYVHILAAGRNARINLPVCNFTMIRDPIYGGLKQVLHEDKFRWVTMDVGMWKGQRAYLEFSDISAPDPGDDSHRNGFPQNGYLAVQRVLFSDSPTPPGEEAQQFSSLIAASGLTRQQLADRYGEEIAAAVRSWSQPQILGFSPLQARLIRWLVRAQLLNAARSDQATALAATYRQVEATIADPARVPAMTEGTGLDERVFVRGNHRLPGEVAQRRFLEAIAGADQSPMAGSGRLDLAERMVDARNPFLSRVIVNRVWLHLFGRGLVPTPDDFGVLGQAPVEPELLDWLAHWFTTEGQWSIKRLIRLLVSSSTYQMSSRPLDLASEEKDPDNSLLHRMPIRRLEGEAIRDAILSISGRLDLTMFGAPIPIHLTEFMEGRGRPGTSGPLDGAGRRSIYVEVRRNFLSPMMRTFDMPVPFTTIGRRTVSNVPAQSLILMNDPFVLGEARRLARHLLSQPGEPPEPRIERLFRSAFNRAPQADEITQARAFLDQQANSYGFRDPARLDRDEIWADLCHVLLNVKEFIFIN